MPSARVELFEASAIYSSRASSKKPNDAPCYRKRMTITLYDMPESPHARKVRLLAAELGIPLNCVRRDPRIGETRSPDYLAKNPNGKVPTLVEDDFVLWESPAILKYLAAKHPERKLAGADARAGGPDRSVAVLVGLRSGGRHRRARLGAAHQAESAQAARQRSRYHRRRAYAHQSLPPGARQTARRSRVHRWPAVDRRFRHRTTLRPRAGGAKVRRCALHGISAPG